MKMWPSDIPDEEHADKDIYGTCIKFILCGGVGEKKVVIKMCHVYTTSVWDSHYKLQGHKKR